MRFDGLALELSIDICNASECGPKLANVSTFHKGHFLYLIPNICQFWYTTSLFETVKSMQKVHNFATKKSQNKAELWVPYAVKDTDLKKGHHRRWWLISAMIPMYRHRCWTWRRGNGPFQGDAFSEGLLFFCLAHPLLHSEHKVLSHIIRIEHWKNNCW